MNKDKFIKLPSDCNGKFIEIGSKLYLFHNKRTITVRSLEYLGNGKWHVWPTSSGGGFALPESQFNVEIREDSI